MITTEEIATVVYGMLTESSVPEMISGEIDYERNDYTKEDVIIIPHAIQGEGSVRFGQVKVNIHVPDLVGTGWNWTIGELDPPIKEPGQNEHFVSLALEITVREKKSN